MIEAAGGDSGGGGVDTGITELTGDVTAGPGSGSQAAAIAANAVTTAKIADLNVTTGKLANLAVNTGKLADSSVTAPKIFDGQVTTVKLQDGGVTTVKIGAAQVTLSKLADLATQRLIGRDTAGTGVPEAITIDQLLDWITGAGQGDILVRGAAGWATLASPAIGLFLGGNGAGVEPSYQNAFGFASPLATAFHLDIRPGVTNIPKNDRGEGCTATGTIITLPVAGSIGASGPYYQIGTSAITNSTAQMSGPTSGAFRELSFMYDFDLTFVVRTDAAAVTTVRYMIGMGVNNENTDPVGANWIGFRFSTATDTGWTGVVFDGTQAVTAEVAPIAANTRYMLRIRKVGSTVFFSVDGGAEVSQSANVPVNNVYANIVLRVTALANAVRSLHIGRLWCDYGA